MYEYYNKIDWSLGVHEFLFSGSVGSAKSLTAAHMAIRHCLENNRARLLLGRRALPDLKDTIFKTILEHLEDDPYLHEGKDYYVNNQRANIKFLKTGSEIMSRSWADKRYTKLRSLLLSGAIIEESVENSGDDYQAITEIRQRVGRLPHVDKQFILHCTNPGSPSHPLYKDLILNPKKIATRHVYYSLTRDNPFLPDWYIDNLMEGMGEREARRMLQGEWLDLYQETLYYAYRRETNFVERSFKPQRGFPIIMSWDFNIGFGKPMSACFMQYVNGIFHVFDEVVLEGQRTVNVLEEAAARGLFDHDTKYIIHGDATARHRDTRSIHSDYDIIDAFLANYMTPKHRYLRYEIDVPRGNPPIRDRHNKTNGVICSAKGIRRLYVYKDAPTVDEGLRLTKLKKGAQYIEDDTPAYQHITTALGYGIMSTLENMDNGSGVFNIPR